MPWATPTLKDVRALTRDSVAAAMATIQIPKNVILASLNAAAASLGNSFLRVMADATAGLGHLVLRYIDWLSKQLLADTAETEWLDRHATLWLSNADGSRGRKAATYATGPIIVTGVAGVVLPASAQLTSSDGTVTYETLNDVVVSPNGSQVNVRALDAGSNGNLTTDEILTFLTVAPSVDNAATVANTFEGGSDPENDDDLRMRILERIQQPPMGGDAEDYVHWCLQFEGVTRAWPYPLEMGMGTVSVRFMEDIVRATNAGIPTAEDVLAVSNWIDSQRPVAVKDIFVLAPIPYPINFELSYLSPDTNAIRAGIEQQVRKMFLTRVIPGETMHRSWLDEAIGQVVGLDSYELKFVSTVMPDNGHIPVLGSIVYAGSISS